MTLDTQDTKGSDQPLKHKLENLEKGDEVEVNCLDDTLIVKDTGKNGLTTIRLEDSSGQGYDLSKEIFGKQWVTIESTVPLSDPLVVRELEVVE